MAPYAYSITKRMQFRGQPEEFSNIYHYDNPPGFTDFDGALNAIATTEKTIFPGTVTFLRGRAWGPTNQGPAVSETRSIIDLTGTGTASFLGQNVYNELCIVAQLYVGRGATGRKRYLRKYYHLMLMPASGDTFLGTSASIATGSRTPFENALNSLKNITVSAQSLPICTPQGDHLPVGTNATTLPIPHIRQFKQ